MDLYVELSVSQSEPEKKKNYFRNRNRLKLVWRSRNVFKSAPTQTATKGVKVALQYFSFRNMEPNTGNFLHRRHVLLLYILLIGKHFQTLNNKYRTGIY